MTSEHRDWRGDEWEKWGRIDPYFGVISDPDFRGVSLDTSARSKFFGLGEVEVAETLAAVRQLAGPGFRPRRALDFGCGVGRLTIPLARVSDEVVAVDVSPALLGEARANCERAGVGNVSFVQSKPGLTGVDGAFDFVHSFIVFQHIPPPIGYELLEAILTRLAPGGAGMLHFTHARRSPFLRGLAQRARRSSRLVHRLLNLVQHRPLSAPLMAMFEYDLSRVLESLQRHGCINISGRLTDHGGCLGVMLSFVRTATD